jgi:hypothetical protein
VSAVSPEPETTQGFEGVLIDHAEEISDKASVWRAIVIVAMLATAVGIAVTGAMDLCRSMGPEVLAVAWLVAPVVAISGMAGVAVVTESTWERIGASIAAVGITGVWLYALVWASVGEAIQGTTC